MFSIYNFDLSNTSSTTLGLISFTTLYFIYKLYLITAADKDNKLNQMEIEKNTYHELSKINIDTKILNNKIKMFIYSRLSELLE
jgi:hypothetical protein